MARIADLFVVLAAISTIATFFGFRALARKAARSLGRHPERKDPSAAPGPQGVVGRPTERKENEEWHSQQ